MPMIPSTIARCGRTAATMSRIERPIPAWCKHVLGPAVNDAGHHAEEILERKRDAGPVMRLHLGERDDQVCSLERIRQGQLAEGRRSESVGNERDIVMVQVDELEAGLLEDVAQAGLVEYKLGIAAMPRPLGDNDLASPPPPENLGDRAHHGRIRVDLGRVHIRLDEVGLQKDRPSLRPRWRQVQLAQTGCR